jgi:hypothetical protein
MDEEKLYSNMIQNVKISKNLSRDELFELKGKPYYRYVDFPLQIDLSKVEINSGPEPIIFEAIKNLQAFDIDEKTRRELILGKSDSPHKCNCPIQVIMSVGCKCGGI